MIVGEHRAKPIHGPSRELRPQKGHEHTGKARGNKSERLLDRLASFTWFRQGNYVICARLQSSGSGD